VTNLSPSGPIDDLPAVSIPHELIRRLLLSRADGFELQVVMVMALITRANGDVDSPVSEDALLRHDLITFASTSDGSPVQDESRIWQAVEQALVHGLVLRFIATDDDSERTWYLLNTSSNVRLIVKMASDPAAVPKSLWISDAPPRISADRPTVFRLYEQNVGPLTPLLAERLIRATETYPLDWIESAISEAVAYNRRNWRYIERILEQWATDGLPSSTGSR
jgi:DNA replication protein